MKPAIQRGASYTIKLHSEDIDLVANDWAMHIYADTDVCIEYKKSDFLQNGREFTKELSALETKDLPNGVYRVEFLIRSGNEVAIGINDSALTVMNNRIKREISNG